jgi:hypothetical protein
VPIEIVINSDDLQEVSTKVVVDPSRELVWPKTPDQV